MDNSRHPDMNTLNQYMIHNYNVEKRIADADEQTKDFGNWKQKVQDLTEKKMILEWYRYRTPLKTLGRLGKPVMELFSISPSYILFTMTLLVFLSLPFSVATSFSIYLVLSLFLSCFWPRLSYLLSNHKLEHGFVVFKLSAIDDNATCYVSFELIRSGILFQIAPTLDAVRDFARGEARCSRADEVQLMDSSEKRGFEGLLKCLCHIRLILKSKKLFNACYNLFMNNCQQTVSKLLECLAKESLDLQFHIPGSEGTVAINDKQIVTFVEKLFPDWKQNKIQHFPEVPDPFAIETKKFQRPMNAKHEMLIFKQKLVRTISKLLSGRELNGRKAILTKLSKDFFEEALGKTKVLGDSTIKQVSNVWKSSLDIVVVLDSLGAIIIHFADKSRVLVNDLREKIDLMSKVENFGRNHIHAISVERSDGESRVDSIKRNSNGYTANITLNPQASEGELEECVWESIKQLSEATSSETGFFSRLSLVWSNFFTKFSPLSKEEMTKAGILQKLTALLFILLNMVSKESLIHERINKQELGPEGCCVWTPEQKKIIKGAKKAFSSNTAIQWIVQGCAGSGKTLLLMKLADVFIMRIKDGNVFIHVDGYNEELIEMLNKQIVDRGSEWKSRVSVGDKIPIDSDRVRLILWDEFRFVDRGLTHHRKTMFHAFDEVRPSVILFSSLSEDYIEQHRTSAFQSIGWIDDLKKQKLNGNLRSSNEVSEFITEYQRYLEQDEWLAGEPVVSSIQWRSTLPEILLLRDDSNDRRLFLQRCKEEIQKLAKEKKDVMVSTYAHASLLANFDILKGANVSSGSSRKILGCQYLCLVIIMDLATCFVPLKELIDTTTRATTSLRVIINTSRQPTFINGIASVRLEVRLTRTVEDRISELISEVAHLGKKILIRDPNEFLSPSFTEEIEGKATKTRRWGGDEESRETSRAYSLVVYISPNGGLDAGVSTLSFPPVIQIVATNDENNVSSCTQKYKEIETRAIEFFTSKAKSCVRKWETTEQGRGHVSSLSH